MSNRTTELPYLTHADDPRDHYTCHRVSDLVEAAKLAYYAARLLEMLAA